MTRLLSIALLGLMTAPTVRALEIQSDFHTQDMNTNVWTWTGNVTMVDGSYRLQADSLTIEYDERNQPCVVKATGDPVRASGATKGEVAFAEGEVLLYNCEDQAAVLIGNASHNRGDYSLAGDRIIYDFLQNQIEAQGNKGASVTTRFNPSDANM